MPMHQERILSARSGQPSQPADGRWFKTPAGVASLPVRDRLAFMEIAQRVEWRQWTAGKLVYRGAKGGRGSGQYVERRVKLEPGQVLISRHTLAADLGWKEKKARGAIASLVALGYFSLIGTSEAGTVLEMAKGPGQKRSARAGLRVIPGGQRANPNGKGPGQKHAPALDKVPISEPQRANPLRRVSGSSRDTNPPHTPPAPAEPEQRGGVLSLWMEAFDGNPPDEPAAAKPNKYRTAVLSGVLGGVEPKDAASAMRCFRNGTHEFKNMPAGAGVVEFSARARTFFELQQRERGKWS